MATSGTYTFGVTRDDIIRQAMLAIGKLSQTESPSAQETTDLTLALNMIFAQMQAGRDFAASPKMWTRQRADLFLSSTSGVYSLGPSGDDWAAGVTALPGQNFGRTTLTNNELAAATTLEVDAIANFTANDYVVVQLASGDTYSTTVSSVGGASIVIPSPGLPSAASAGAYVVNYTTKGQRPNDILTAVLRDVNGADTPLDRMTLQTYEALPVKTASAFASDPVSFYYEQQLTNGTLYLDVGGASDVSKHIHVVYVRPVQDVGDTADNPEYPSEWFMALVWSLAKYAAPMYSMPWTTDMQDNYITAVRMAQQSTPDSTEMYFEPGGR